MPVLSGYEIGFTFGVQVSEKKKRKVGVSETYGVEGSVRFEYCKCVRMYALSCVMMAAETNVSNLTTRHSIKSQTDYHGNLFTFFRRSDSITNYQIGMKLTRIRCVNK